MNATTRTGSLSGDETSSDDDSSEDEAFTDLKTLAAQSDLPNDFWQVRYKLIFHALFKTIYSFLF